LRGPDAPLAPTGETEKLTAPILSGSRELRKGSATILAEAARMRMLYILITDVYHPRVRW